MARLVLCRLGAEWRTRESIPRPKCTLTILILPGFLGEFPSLPASGLWYKEVPPELEISEHTVRTHVEEIARRIGCGLKPRDAMVHHWVYSN